MIMRLIMVMCAAAFVNSTPVAAKSKVSVQAAERICLKRVKRFAQTPYGRGADAPAPYQVRDRFRACVWAKSGGYPQRRLKVRGWNVSL